MEVRRPKTEGRRPKSEVRSWRNPPLLRGGRGSEVEEVRRRNTQNKKLRKNENNLYWT